MTAAYIAAPDEPHAAVVVAHELFGVTDHVRAVCDRVAALGYTAVAPDFFSDQGPATELQEDDEGRAKGFELLGALSRDVALRRAGEALDEARGLVPGPVGMLGLSVGGHIAHLAATEFDLAGTVVAYAGWLAGTDIPLARPEPTIERTPALRGSMLMVVGEDDPLIGAADRGAIEAAFASGVDARLIVLPGVGHGFLAPHRASYSQDATDRVWAEIESFFAVTLR